MSDIKKINETCCGPGYASQSDDVKAVSYTHLTLQTTPYV